MNPILNATLGIALIFLCTTLGASFVFFFRKRKVSPIVSQISLGLAGGIMLSASFFSLILPSVKTKTDYLPGYLIAAIGIFLGAFFLYGIDKLLPHLHVKENEEEGIPTKKLGKTAKMFLAVTIHNIPEGLSVGIAYGIALALSQSHPESEEALSGLSGAFSLALGIGIQNIPEGTSVSLPIKAETGKTGKAFLFGMLSGAVEPVSALVGLFLAMNLTSLMPWALSFAGGAMLYVIAEEMIPDASKDPLKHYGVWSFMAGFVLMMVLDVALG